MASPSDELRTIAAALIAFADKLSENIEKEYAVRRDNERNAIIRQFHGSDARYVTDENGVETIKSGWEI